MLSKNNSPMRTRWRHALLALIFIAAVVIAAGAWIFALRQDEFHILAFDFAMPAGGANGVADTRQVNILGHLLLALAVVIITARCAGFVFQRLGQPPVVGEMLAGILLGPSLLSHYFPGILTFVLPASTTPSLNLIGQLGVIFYMFLIGLHLDPANFRARARLAMVTSQLSIAAPFALGALLAFGLYPAFAPSGVSLGVFALFVGLSMSVTAFPVLARILEDRGLAKTGLGSLALTCAAINDVVAWFLLALVVGIANSSFGGALQTLILFVLFVLFMLVVLRPLVGKLARYVDVRGVVGQGMLALVVVALLLSALATEWIGIHALFGAFLFGVILPSKGTLAQHLNRVLHEIVLVFLLPAYFAFTGLRTQIGLINGLDQWLVCALIIVVAMLGKVGGTIFGARLVGLDWRKASALGVLMNTRGLMEIIVLNIGLDLHVLSPTLFTMLVLMAIVTTMMTTPVLDRLVRRA